MSGGHSERQEGGMQQASNVRPSNGQPKPNDWVVLNRDYTWEEVVFDDQGGEIVVQRCRTLSDQTLSSYGRVFDPSKLRDVCKQFLDQRRFLGKMTGDVWQKLLAYDKTGASLRSLALPHSHRSHLFVGRRPSDIAAGALIAFAAPSLLAAQEPPVWRSIQQPHIC